MLLWLLAADADAERLKQLGVGGAIVVTVLGMVFAFILKWREVKGDPESLAVAAPTNGKAGAVPVSYWENKNRDIAETVAEKQTALIVAEVQEARQEAMRKFIEILDCLRRIEILLERRRAPR